MSTRLPTSPYRHTRTTLDEAIRFAGPGAQLWLRVHGNAELLVPITYDTARRVCREANGWVRLRKLDCETLKRFTVAGTLRRDRNALLELTEAAS